MFYKGCLTRHKGVVLLPCSGKLGFLGDERVQHNGRDSVEVAEHVNVGHHPPVHRDGCQNTSYSVLVSPHADIFHGLYIARL